MKATKWDKGDGYFHSPLRRDKPHPALCTQQKGERVLIHDAAPGGSLPAHCPMRWDATTAVRQPDHVSKERPSCPFPAHGSDHRVKKAVGVSPSSTEKTHGGRASQGHTGLGVLLRGWRPASPPTRSSRSNLHVHHGLGGAQSVAVVTCSPWPWG